MTKNYLLFHRKQKLKNSQVSAQAKNMRKIIKLLKIRRYKLNRMSKRKYFCDIWVNCAQSTRKNCIHKRNTIKNYTQNIKLKTYSGLMQPINYILDRLKPIMIRRHPP